MPRTIARHISYLQHVLAGNPWIDFVSMGFGIQRRAERFRRSWEPHLSATRSFIEQHTREGGAGIVILGAGRMYDVPLQELMGRFDSVHLVDIDPSLTDPWNDAKKIWGPRLTTQLCDVTGVLLEWQQRLTTCRTSRDLAWFLHTDIPIIEFPFPTILSLNVLSQLGVMWRDRVIAYCRRKGILLTHEIEHIIAVSSARLELAHVASLATHASEIILVADRTFVTVNRRGEVVDEEEALYGPWPDTIGNYAPSGQANWRWEIVPIGGEISDRGTIHEVQARYFRKLTLPL